MATTTQPRGIEVRSIDWVPEDARHGRIWHQAPLRFLGNFQYVSIPIGFIGPGLGLSLVWTVVAGVLGILTGTVSMAFHAAQGPTLGLPQTIQSRAQFGYPASSSRCSPRCSPTSRSTSPTRCCSPRDSTASSAGASCSSRSWSRCWRSTATTGSTASSACCC